MAAADEVESPEANRRSRRSLRPGWWLLIGLVLIVAVATVTYGLQVRSANATIAMIEASGGVAQWSHRFDWKEKWLPEIFAPGVDCMRFVSIGSDSHGVEPFDEAELVGLLSELSRFEEIEFLALRRQQVGAEAMGAIGRQRNLHEIVFSDCEIEDQALASLAGHPELTFLHFPDCRLGDDAIPYLAKLPKLAGLSLDGTNITDDGLAELSQSPALQYLSLSNTAVTDSGVSALASKIPHVEVSDD